MKKRLLSFLLIFCMMLSVLPTNILAVGQQDAQALYAQMLSLGLVDANGQLIEDNTFTVEDGTKLGSLTELKDWLASCSADDFDTRITVDATNRSATAEQIANALSIEYDLADIVAQLDALASAASPNAVPAQANPTAGHDVKIDCICEYQDDLLIFQVGIIDGSGANFTAAPCDITLEAALFADFLTSNRLNIWPDNSSALRSGIGVYKTFTLSKGEKYLEFQYDLNKIRENYLKTLRKDLWDGSTEMLFQCRVVGGAKLQAFSRVLRISPEDEKNAVLDAFTGNTPALNTSGSLQPYRLALVQTQGGGTEMTKKTVDGKSVFAFTISDLYEKDSSLAWTALYRKALDCGAGNPSDPRIALSQVTFITKSYTIDQTGTPVLYFADDGDALHKMNLGFSVAKNRATKPDYAKAVAAAYTGNWSYSADNSQMKTLYDNLISGSVQTLLFPTVEVPFYGTLKEICETEWYLSADWCSPENKPHGFCLPGQFSLVDTTAPTIKSIEVPDVTFYPGDEIPITVTFSEPVIGDYELVLQSGTGTVSYTNCTYGWSVGTIQRSGSQISATRTFYYTVRDADSTALEVLGVKGGDGCTDALGNAFVNGAGDYQEFHVTLAEDKIVSGRPQDSIAAMSAETDKNDPCKATVTVSLKDNAAFTQLWASWANAEEKPFTASIVLNQDPENQQYPLTVVESDGKLLLQCSLSLPALASGTKDHTAELYLDGQLCYGAYSAFQQTAVVKAPADAYTISADTWPSGLANTVYLQDAALASFSAVSNNKAFTYDNIDQLYWKISDERVIQLYTTGDSLSLADSASVSVVAGQAGTAALSLWAKNNSDDPAMHSQASNAIVINVKDGGSPCLLFPAGANTVYARHRADQTVYFASNLANHEPADEKITVRLDDAEGQTVWTSACARNATSLKIPGSVLTAISTGDDPAYTLHLSADAVVDGKTVHLATQASIIVRSQPAVITLSGLDVPQFLSGSAITFGWRIENFDLAVNPDACRFQLLIEKDGQTIQSITDAGTNVEGQTYEGTVTFTPETPDGLKHYYIITAKAKNSADPTWSTASSTVAVYKDGSLKLIVGGKDTDSVTLENQVTGSETTTDPTIINYNGNRFSGLTNAQAIARLRSELSLMETIHINFEDYDWSLLQDMIRWQTTTGQGGAIEDALDKAVSINYRRGSLYEPLEKFSYTSYLPQTVLLLAGLRDGTNIVTAEHQSVEGLSDSVRVDVNRLADKLYLFQFTPAVKTEVSYEDGLGVTHTVFTNDDGSLALFEPNGIASDLRAACLDNNTSYRGTFSKLALKSGEGNGAKGELYPINVFSLRLAAVAQVKLLKPDGTALANTEVILRGGVYRNRHLAANRDDAYCAGARFARAAGQAAALDGKTDHTFVTDENGVLTVHMDLEQFITANDPDPVGVGDALQFIFELRFADNRYQPELVTVNGSLTERDAMRSGENIVTFIQAGTMKPFIAVQTVDYFTNRKINVRFHTGVVGPSSNYPEVLLESTVMLWGLSDVSLTDTGYRMDLRSQENAVVMPGQSCQTVQDSSYPFSSIPLIVNTAVLDADSFFFYTANRRTAMEAALYRADGSLNRTLALPFGLVDMNALEKVEDSPSLLSLMANLAIYGRVNGADTKYDLVNTVSDGIFNDALSFIADMGAEAGLVKAILMPTEDPTRYQGYFWTGLNTTKLEDLNYDDHGISLEPSYIGQDYDSLLGQVNDTFTLSDFQAMADGSYFDDRNNLYAAASGAIGAPIMLILEGWMNTEIRYNFDEGRWDVLMTGGGFTAGGQLEYEHTFNIKPLGIPLTASFKVRGGLTVNFEAAVRYAEQLGLEWNDDTADAVNDYLTALRINAYFEFFGGLGHDKGFTAKVGVFGSIEINNENRFLTRKYLKNPDERDLKGQYLQLDGEAGLRAALGVGPLVTEITLISLGFSTNWRFNDWNTIYDYWNEASSGLGSTGWMEGQPGGQSADGQMRVALLGGDTPVAFSNVVKLQSRDYLAASNRAWLGESVQTLSNGRTADALLKLLANAYPFTNPLISNDGAMMVYLSDGNSVDVADTKVHFTLSNGEMFPKGSAIPDGADGFSGYGDSSLAFAGSAAFAGAAWLREAATLGLKAGTPLDEAQQAALLGGLEVMASIWNGQSWETTRLTDNASQEVSPVIAVSENGTAIAAWRSVQTADSLFTFEQERILYRIYDGTRWGDETYTLYNGSSGSVSGLAAEMLSDGTASIAYALDGEIYYGLIDTAAAAPEDSAKIIRATTGSDLNEDPQLTAVGGEFVLAWHSVQSRSGAQQHDVGLRVYDRAGSPRSDFPESLSNLVSTASFDGQFALVKGASSLDALSILWNDSGAGDADNDILRGVKFGRYNGQYGASAPMEIAMMPSRTGLDHVDACTVSPDGTAISAVLLGTTYSADQFDEVSFSYEYVDADGKTQVHSGTGRLPKETVNLYQTAAAYEDAVGVSSTFVDFSSLAANAWLPVTFTVTNEGFRTMESVSIQLDGAAAQTFSGLSILPGQSATFAVVTKTGETIEDLSYTVSAGFANGGTQQTTGTVYLDYPDAGISGIRVTKEQDGLRTFLAALYNQSAVSLSKAGRRVVLGVYSDPECQTPVNGVYFANGVKDTAYEVVLTADALTAMDGAGYAQEITFDIGAYVRDAGLTEIPSAGVTLFTKVRIETLSDGAWITLPEADNLNNQQTITFDSLLARNDGLPATLSVELENNGTASSAVVTIQNNSLAACSSGNLTAALLDADGRLLEAKRINSLPLSGEAREEIPLSFSKAGSRVVLRYGGALSDDNTNAKAASITLDAMPLTLASFDESNHASLSSVPSGSYLLTVTPEHPEATIAINGKDVPTGMVSIPIATTNAHITIVITAPDGKTTCTYTIDLNVDAPVYENNHLLRFAVNGGKQMPSLLFPVDSTVDLTAYKPQRSGYYFTGWFRDAALTEAVTAVKMTADTTVYAGWIADFEDVGTGDWFYPDVMYVYANGLMLGTGGNRFNPHGTATRAMMATVLWRMAGSPAPKTQASFTDTAAGQWYSDAVAWTAENGIFGGYGNGKFGTNDPITREQLATILYRFAAYCGDDMSASGDLTHFPDANRISTFAKQAMHWAVGAGLINGKGDGSLDPLGTASRAEIAALLHRFCEK